ncbi:hypothetical protein GX51_08274 [Blastomyces parvus]|uniref:CCHC-type domain-containing protein n=1 Tax=Blastomyces parvus TaxID=2060905 RepID=A0A2B7WF76_9EURO|nr:hypothetical protein GX51_08274 [Blastomyces parvus]
MSEESGSESNSTRRTPPRSFQFFTADLPPWPQVTSPPSPSPQTVIRDSAPRTLFSSGYRESTAERVLDSSSEDGGLSEDSDADHSQLSPLASRAAEVATATATTTTTAIQRNKQARQAIIEMASSGNNPLATIADPTFSICGKFSGEKGQSVSRWLVKLEWELRASKVEGKVPAQELLPAINLLLTGEAEDWIQSNPSILRLLENPTEDNRTTFLEAFKDQFPEKSTEEKVSCEAEMAKLIQETMSLTEYYQLGVKVLRRLAIKDQAPLNAAAARKPEVYLLEAFISNWIRGLTKSKIRTKLIEVADELTTLSAAYRKALNVERAENELKKDRQAREISKELTFLRKVAESTLDSERRAQLNAVYARRVTAVEDEPEWEVPQGLLTQPKSTRTRPQNNNPKQEKLQDEPLQEGPEGQRSTNDFVNGTKQFRKDGPQPLCVECGKLGHISTSCQGPPLEAWEKSILRDKVFPKAGVNAIPTRGKAATTTISSHLEATGGTETADVKSVAAGVAGLSFDDGYLPLQCFLGEGSAPNKRAASITRDAARKRREVGEENSQTIPPEETTVPKQPTKRQGLAILKGFAESDDPSFKPLSVREILGSFKSEIPLPDLLQYSPFLVAGLKKFMTRETAGRRKKTVGPGVASHSVTASADVNTRLLKQLKNEEKAFRVPAQIKVNGKIIDLPRAATQADQGSELNLVSEPFIKKYGLKVKPLSEIGYQGMSMKTATKVETILHHWVELDVAVEGVWRKADCFVAPTLKKSVIEIDLLLGIPWLYDVNARLDIRRGALVIGDTDKGEARTIVQGPELVYAPDTKILMYPPHLFDKGDKKSDTTQEKKKEPRFDFSIEDPPPESEEEDDDGYQQENYEGLFDMSDESDSSEEDF